MQISKTPSSITLPAVLWTSGDVNHSELILRYLGNRECHSYQPDTITEACLLNILVTKYLKRFYSLKNWTKNRI